MKLPSGIEIYESEFIGLNAEDGSVSEGCDSLLLGHLLENYDGTVLPKGLFWERDPDRPLSDVDRKAFAAEMIRRWTAWGG